MPADLTLEEIESLRAQHYNAKVLEIRQVHEDLRILRILPDHGMLSFRPGQYTVLGLGYWEHRFADLRDDPHTERELRKVCKRAYSISHPMLDENGNLLSPGQCPFLEFYIVLIRRASDHAPALTPRLFDLHPGDRLFIGPGGVGHYTLDPVKPGQHCVFIATGTGEAPHNAMIAQLLSSGHQGRIVSIICSRYLRDQGYLQEHRLLESRYPNYRYVSLTTREPENVDPLHPGYIGKRYVQEFIESGQFEQDLDFPLNPEKTHVFLCGNPTMIGAPLRHADGTWTYPETPGMVELLESRGFQADRLHEAGNIHFEKYW